MDVCPKCKRSLDTQELKDRVLTNQAKKGLLELFAKGLANFLFTGSVWGDKNQKKIYSPPYKPPETIGRKKCPLCERESFFF